MKMAIKLLYKGKKHIKTIIIACVAPNLMYFEEIMLIVWILMDYVEYENTGGAKYGLPFLTKISKTTHCVFCRVLTGSPR